MPIPPHNSAPLNPSRWGAAAKFDFDNKSKWHTVPSVPLLDEHELTNDAGRPIAVVDRAALQEIADNGNRKIIETGDPATLILGHTSDDPRAPEKPSQGFLTNLQVKPFKRLADGKVIYALHGDYKLRPNKAHLIEDYPRRSVELWWSKRDVDPVAMLGGSAPERDLGAVIRQGRLNHVALASEVPTSGTRSGAVRPDDLDVIRFHRRGNWTIENYTIDAPAVRPPRPTRYEKSGTMPPLPPSKNGKFGMKTSQPPRATPAKYEEDCGDKMRYGDDEGLDTEDLGGDGGGHDYDGGDEAVPTGMNGGGGHGTTDLGAAGGEGDDTGAMSPAVAELLQTKQFKQMQDQLATISQLLQGLVGGGAGEPGGGPGAGADGAGMGLGGDDGGAGGEEMPPPGGGTGGPPGGPGAPPPDTEESRRGMGERPVQMSETSMPNSTGFAGAGDSYTPGFDSVGKSKTRRMSRGTNTPQRGTPMTVNETVVKLQRQVASLQQERKEERVRYARSEAERRIDALVNEGYQFGPTADAHTRNVEAEKRHWAHILASAPTTAEGIADVDAEEEVIRERYARKRADPTRVNTAGISRFSRDPSAAGARPGAAPVPDGDSFVPETDEEGCEFADLVGVRKMSRKDAGVVMLQRRTRR